MKLFNKIKELPKLIKAILALNKAISLQEVGRDREALTLLDKYTEILKTKSVSYHLNRGRILFNGYKDYKKAIEEFSQGISVIDSKKRMKPNKREYLLAWAKYMMAGCYYELGDKDNAEHWRGEYEKHYYESDNIPSITRNEFPMK